VPFFDKQILKPGTYNVPAPDGTMQKVHLSAERFKRWVDNFKKMAAAGLNIPAPWRHDEKAIPLRLSADQGDTDAFQNGGFWRDLWVDNNGTLHGRVEVPDEETAKQKIGKTVREVSPLVKGKWADGAGNEYEDAITHIALVTHPVAQAQENFTPIAASLAFSHSQLLVADEELVPPELQFQVVQEPATEMPEPTSASNATVQDAVGVLRELGLNLPDDTTPENILERIVTAGLALRSERERSPDTNAPPVGATEPRGPITMSQQNQTVPSPSSSAGPNAQAAPPTSPPATVALSQEHQAALNFASKVGRQMYIDRIDKLVNSGRITPDYANKTLSPYLSDLRLSFDADGNPMSGELDKLLLALEALPQNQVIGGSVVSGIRSNGQQMFSLATQPTEVPNEHLWRDNTAEPSEDEAIDIVNQQFQNTGRSHFIRGPQRMTGRPV